MVYPLPNDRSSDLSKFSEFEVYKPNVTQLKFLSGGLENIVEKQKMLVTSIFSFCHDVFRKDFFQGVVTRGCLVKDKL